MNDFKHVRPFLSNDSSNHFIGFNNRVLGSILGLYKHYKLKRNALNLDKFSVIVEKHTRNHIHKIKI